MLSDANEFASIDEGARKGFERAWLSGSPRPIEAFLPPAHDPHFAATLEELVHIELEMAWKAAASDGGAAGPRVEKYLGRFPCLAQPEVLERLCREEFLVRHGCGDRPEPDEYFRRFPQLLPRRGKLERSMADALASVAELCVGDLFQRLSECDLIESGPVAALCRGLDPPPGPDDDARPLLGRMVASGVLTDYQADRLRLGEARGLVLGNYEILDRVGAGGMGEVYRARHRRMDRVVALKTLPARLVDSDEALRRFERETRALAQLHHPNIVTAHDAGEADGVQFLVMELVEGRNLSELVRDEGPMPVGRAVDCTLQAARGLEYAHARGVLHRDIKPSNLLLDAEGNVRILDLGLAAVEEPSPSADGPDGPLTASGAVMGTADFMAPEQALDTHRADARADVYSLGCTLFYLLTGRTMYSGDSVLQRILAHREEPIPSLVRARDDVPPELETVYQRMVAKEADGRFPSMSEVIAALEPCAEASAASASGMVRSGVGRPRSADTDAPSAAETVALAPSPRAAGTRVPTSRRRTARWLGIATIPVVAVALLSLVALFRPTKKETVPEKLLDPSVVHGSNPGSPNGAQAGSVDPHRRAAMMVIERGGEVSLITATKSSEFRVSKAEDLPSEPFVLREASFIGAERVEDDDLMAFRGVPFLDKWMLNGTAVTGAGLEKLPELAVGYLDLTSTQFTDQGVQMLARRPDLWILQMSSPRLTDAACQYLRQCPRLRDLKLGEMTLTDQGLRELAGLTSLNHMGLMLGLQGSRTPKGWQALTALPNLRRLELQPDIFGDDVADALSELHQLRFVCLGSGVSDEAARRLQAALPRAAVLHPGVVPGETRQQAVRWVLEQGGTVSGPRSDQDNSLNPVTFRDVPDTCFVVQTIIFQDAECPSGGAEHLVGLPAVRTFKWKNLANADAEAEHLAKLDSLDTLNLSNTDLSAAGLGRLTALDQLERLFLRDAPELADDACRHLEKFAYLRYLDLTRTSIADAGLVSVGRITSLQSLNLTECDKITSAGVMHLARLPILRSLTLDATAMDDAAVDHLAKMPCLRILLVRETELTADGIARLHAALPRCAILWDGGLVLPRGGADSDGGNPPRRPRKERRAVNEHGLSVRN